MHDIKFSDTLFKKKSGISIFFVQIWLKIYTLTPNVLKLFNIKFNVAYAALIKLYDLLKLVPFFGPPDI